ncbi:hypothetical protein ABBQ32_005971 [Trebouxia sp. C0010 RCD-2024]
MHLNQSCHHAQITATPVPLHARASLNFSADQNPPSLTEAAYRDLHRSSTLKQKHLHSGHSHASGRSATYRRGHQTPHLQASTSNASTEAQPKIVGLGLACWDFLAQVATFPKPDDKMRTERMETRGGGNCANALTAASRLGADTYLVTKLGKDSIGDQIVSELENDGVNTQFVLRDDGLSAFGYMIVDKQGGTRTSILTPGVEHTPQDLPAHIIDAILENASLVYFDGRLTDCAILLAKAARQKGVPVLVEAERPRQGLGELLQQADYLCTSTHFPQSFTSQSTLGDAMICLMQQLPRVQWIITTLGKKGSVLVEKASPQDAQEDAVLQDMLNKMLTEASSSSSKTSSTNGASRHGCVSIDSAACTSKTQVHIRAGSTLSSEKAYKLQRTAPEPQQDEAVIGWGSAGHAKPNVAGRITVATAAHVPQYRKQSRTQLGLETPSLAASCTA